MEPQVPFWFKQRQCKLEAAGENAFKVSGPNLGEAYVRIFPANGSWKAAVRAKADGPDVAVTSGSLPTTNGAWDAAFELYRTHFIVCYIAGTGGCRASSAPESDGTATHGDDDQRGR